MTKMLRRLLGEDITLHVNYAPNLPSIHADPGMMEQILMNLSVNSRDAMPKGGKLFIDTLAARVTEATASRTAGASPGDYVCLKVRTRAWGFRREVMRIFRAVLHDQGRWQGNRPGPGHDLRDRPATPRLGEGNEPAGPGDNL